jgi:hypothetical protein
MNALPPLRKPLVGLGILVAGLAFSVLIHERLGRLAWTSAKAGWIAQGEPTDIATLACPPLDPGQSYFSRHPLLQAQVRFKPLPGGEPGEVIYDDAEAQHVLGSLVVPDWIRAHIGTFLPPTRTDFAGLAADHALPEPDIDPVGKLARHFAKDDDIFRTLIEAARLPAGHFGMIWDVEDIRDARTPHYPVWTRIARISSLRARVALAQHRPDDAVAELTVILRLAETLRGDPVLLAGMVQSTLRMIVLHVIWEGLESRSWNGEQLALLDRELATWMPIEDLIRCYQGDRALAVTLPDRKPSEEEWDRSNQLFGAIPRWPFRIPGMSYWTGANLFRAQTRHCYFPLVTRDWRRIEAGRSLLRKLPDHDLHSLETRRELPFYLSLTERSVDVATYTLLARTAVALERHFIAEEKYPDNLAALVPGYLASIPSDVMDNASLRYALSPDRRYLLYSVGWNFEDDGGRRQDRSDLVWSYEIEGSPPRTGRGNR